MDSYKTRFNLLLGHFVKQGNKKFAVKRFMHILLRLKNETKMDPELVLDKVIEDLYPVVGLRAKKVAGTVYRVPFIIKEERRVSLAIRWILSAAAERAEATFDEKLIAEFVDLYNGKGLTLKKKLAHERAIIVARTKNFGWRKRRRTYLRRKRPRFRRF